MSTLNNQSGGTSVYSHHADCFTWLWLWVDVCVCMYVCGAGGEGRSSTSKEGRGGLSIEDVRHRVSTTSFRRGMVGKEDEEMHDMHFPYPYDVLYTSPNLSISHLNCLWPCGCQLLGRGDDFS